MRSPRHIVPAGALGAAAALLAVLAIVPGAGARSARAAASCTRVSNIEAIIDDSGSMALTDPNRLRVQALDLLIETPGNEAITLGALDFGGAFFSNELSTETVFPPEAIGPNAKAMEAALNAKIKASHGATDYNAAFAKAKADDPGATAWIFLTDGGHNVGEYQNGHRGGPPTYVVSFGNAITPPDAARLQQIASENHGKYFPQTDSSNLQAVVNQIGTALTCQTPPKTFTDAFAKVGQRKSHSVALGAKVRSAQLTLSWASPLDSFTIAGVRIVRRGKTVAVARVRRVKVTTRRGSTFLVMKLSKLVPGTLRFQVRAGKLSSTTGGVKLTSQVTQAR